MFVCLCRAVSDTRIRQVIHAGARTAERVGETSGAGTRCGKCRVTIESMIDRETEQHGLEGHGIGERTR